MANFYFPQLSRQIITSANKVHSTLGHGLPEQCYQNALMIEFKRQDIIALKECRHKVYYAGELVGYFKSDIIVDKKVILELKSVKAIHDEHRAQLLNYLRLTGFRVGYVLNFGGLSMQFRRLVM